MDSRAYEIRSGRAQYVFVIEMTDYTNWRELECSTEPVDGTAKKRRAALLGAGDGAGCAGVRGAAARIIGWACFTHTRPFRLCPWRCARLRLRCAAPWPFGPAFYLCRSFAARAALAILLCGALFCFANPPMQTPDESTHFLRANAISMGRFDFDYDRPYPADVNALIEAFPGSYVNANTTFWLEHDEAGQLMGGGSSANYAIKQFADGTRTGIADGFARYAALCESGDAAGVAEPQMFQVLPYLPQALCMAAARLLGFGALGSCMPGALPTWPCIRRCAGWR